MNAYQDCNLITKLWRQRYLLSFPCKALCFWFRYRKNKNSLSLKSCLRLHRGLAHAKMRLFAEAPKV